MTYFYLHSLFLNATLHNGKPFRFEELRTDRGAYPPFVPQLGNATDTKYFDDFENPEDMAMYKEVRKRQQIINKETNKRNPRTNEEQRELRGDFIGFTFKHRGSHGNNSIKL